jgi:ribosomal protein L19E
MAGGFKGIMVKEKGRKVESCESEDRVVELIRSGVVRGKRLQMGGTGRIKKVKGGEEEKD